MVQTSFEYRQSVQKNVLYFLFDVILTVHRR